MSTRDLWKLEVTAGPAPSKPPETVCWQGLICRVLNLGWTWCIRCYARRLAPHTCCQTFSERGLPDFADHTRRNPPRARGATSPSSSNSPRSRVPHLSNQLLLAPMGELTLSDRIRKIATLNFAAHNHQNLRRPPPVPAAHRLRPSLLRAAPDIAQRL